MPAARAQPQTVRITDVSPRDGLQNEPAHVPTRDKARLIALLREANVDEIEVTSFVSPRWVPQLGDAAELLAALPPAPDGPVLSALVPNEKGMEAFLAARAATGQPTKLALFTAASETFCKRNINATIAESLRRFVPVIDAARAHPRVFVRAYISCALACPFEGPIAPAAVARLAERLADLGVDEIDVADTIGAATPATTTQMLAAVRSGLGDSWWTREKLTLHLHDTFGNAAACVLAALDAGVRSFDAAAGGLGGCPYASPPDKPAPGNIATELLVWTLERAGYATGVDKAKLAAAGAFARSLRGPEKTP